VGLATPSPPRAEDHERVELYLYSPSWALRACYRVNLYLYYGAGMSNLRKYDIAVFQSNLKDYEGKLKTNIQGNSTFLFPSTVFAFYVDKNSLNSVLTGF
jgi:hypothetical protein